MRTAASLLGKLWWYVRQVSGDADYENYLRAAARHGCCPGESSSAAPPLSAEEFYLDRQRRKYNTVSRCC